MMAGHGATHRGRVRRHNEDGMLVDPPLGLFAVADGMGGHNAGEVASALALEAVLAFVRRSHEDSDHTWPFGLEPDLDGGGNRLRTAVKLANRRVFRESQDRRQYSGMGTTVAAVLVDGSRAALCGVGDSRVYLVRSHGTTRLTRDHSWAEALLADNPDLDRQMLANHPMRHVLTVVLGVQDDLEVAVLSHPITGGERFVICSDGVHGELEDAVIGDIVRAAPDVEAAAERLVEAALEHSGRDNITAVVAGRVP
jgi:PPM family protein phosphatase